MGKLTAVFARRPRWLAPLAVGVLAACWFVGILFWMQAAHPELLFEGFRFRDESSDSAWQTLRLWELWLIGPRALWLSHIYPPAYDAIRWVLMQPEVSKGESPSILAVDQRLYLVSAVLFAIVASVIYLWIRDLTHKGWWAFAGATLWCLLPASISFFTLMNQTGLAITSMAIAFYLLYRFCRTRRNVYASGFLASIFVASMTRNVSQVHVVIVLALAAICFYFMGRPRRPWALVVNVILVALICVWPARSYILYSTFDVSTHTGYNRAGALWINPASVPEPTWPDNIVRNGVDLSSGWNTQETLRDNYRLGLAANDFMLHHPVEAAGRLWASLKITMPVMFRSVYVQWSNAFLLVFPLAQPLDWIFSGFRFVALIAAAIIIIGWKAGGRGSLRLLRRYAWFGIVWVLVAIPVVFSNRYWPVHVPEPIHSEADRLRALIDTPIYVLLVYAAFLVARGVWPRRVEPTPPSGALTATRR